MMHALTYPTTTVSTNMQTYVPKKVQEKLELKSSESLEWIVGEDDVITIRKIPTTKDVIAYTRGASGRRRSKKAIDKRMLKEREGGWSENE